MSWETWEQQRNSLTVFPNYELKQFIDTITSRLPGHESDDWLKDLRRCIAYPLKNSIKSVNLLCFTGVELWIYQQLVISFSLRNKFASFSTSRHNTQLPYTRSLATSTVTFTTMKLLNCSLHYLQLNFTKLLPSRQLSLVIQDQLFWLTITTPMTAHAQWLMAADNPAHTCRSPNMENSYVINVFTHFW